VTSAKVNLLHILKPNVAYSVFIGGGQSGGGAELLLE